jgi:hypothetical protein
MRENGLSLHSQIYNLRLNLHLATYGGHMELSAFAHMARRNVKVVQPGLVYVIEWQAFYSPTSPQTATPAFPDKEDLHHEPTDDDSTIYVAYAIPLHFHFVVLINLYIDIMTGNISHRYETSKVPTSVCPESRNALRLVVLISDLLPRLS